MTQRTAGSVQLHAGGRIRPIDVDTSRDLYQILLTAFVSATRGEGRPTVTVRRASARSKSHWPPKNPYAVAEPSAR